MNFTQFKSLKIYLDS